MHRKSWYALSFAVACLAQSAIAQTERPPFDGFETEDPESNAGIVFAYSTSRATEDDPVVITRRYGEREASDREHRVSLQRLWLAINVPEAWEGTMRVQSTCHRKGDRDARCDQYTFVDPKTKQEHAFYFYLNNWH